MPVEEESFIGITEGMAERESIGKYPGGMLPERRIRQLRWNC
jgi:hypothetical protein